MHHLIDQHRADIAMLCRRYGVRRLDLFGSAARGSDFDPASSDADFVVEFELDSDISPLSQFFGLADDLAALLGRPVGLAERKAVEASRNDIRRNAIMGEAKPVYGPGFRPTGCTATGNRPAGSPNQEVIATRARRVVVSRKGCEIGSIVTAESGLSNL